MARPAALLGLPLSFRVRHRDPAPSRRHPCPKAVAGWPDDTSSPGLSSPYDTVSDRQIRPTADPSAAAYRVRGLATPFATSTTGPPGACAPERPWASPFKVFSSTAVGTPLGAHTLLTLPTGPAPPRGETRHDAAAFRVSFPRRVRSVTGTTEVIPAVDPFLGFILPELAPVRPGARFDRGASPLALRRLDVQARPGLRVLRCERVERSVSGPPALLGFRTFRHHGAPYIAPRGGLIASPHAAARKCGPLRSMPHWNDATADPGPAARHRCHSVFDR